MKYLFTWCLLVFGLFVNAQRKVSDTIRVNYVKNYKLHGANLKGYNVDGKFVATNQPLQLDPTDIKDIRVNKTERSLDLTTYHPGKHNFLTLDEIAEKYLKLDQSPRLYIVDQQIIRAIQSYKIDESYILSIEVVYSNDFEYLKAEQKPLFQLIRISLRTPENLKNASQIRIR